ncbi:ras guanine nucleotide exchange factor domain-containing protein [Syncephalastrum racemosum]|uniref:Ras guanine nucleotide exchange factor domain-containing protein n=1 Tax=Syncephalastrum racemosum TaxID=13706 RepID=A0A1X2HK94_SYNRA|nr:ras guanine nucleotide exchange factor domain-containing protein [Syncephalastrum racemosum]
MSPLLASKKFFRGISIKSQQTTMVNMLHTSQGAGSAQQQQPDLTKMDMSRKRSKAKQTNAFKTFFGRKSSPQKDRQQQQQQSSRIKELFTLPKSTSTTSLHTDLKTHWKRPRAGSSSSSSQSLYQSDTGSVWQWQRGLEAEDCISYNEEAEEKEQEEDEEQEKEWAKIKDKQDERPQPIDDDDKALISAGSFSGRRQQQRASVQMLASPFSRRTYIRMTDEGLGRFAVSLPEHEDTVCPMGLARTNGYAADQSIDSYSEEDEALEDEERPKSEASTSDSCYFSSSSSQATLTSESPVYPCDAHKSFLKPPQAGMQTVQEEERGYSHLKNENYRGKSPFAKEKEGLKHFRSESDLSRLQQQQTHTLAKTDEKPKAPPFKLAKTSKLKPPQRRHSVRSQLSIASRRSGGGHNSSDTRSIKEPGEQGSWSLLRAMRRNQSSANLKKEAEGRDMLRKAGLESSIVTSDFSDEKSMHGDTRILHVSENGCDVMVMEMVSGRLHVVAGTAEKLFLKLADETTQDLDFVDTYILCHVQFTTSMALLEDLIARFHLEAGPGETAYFEKWQHSIQVKVLSVLTRWVKLQYQDFDNAPILLARLEAFLNDDIKRAGFDTEVDMIREALDLQMAKHARRRHSLVALTSHAVVVPSNSSTPLPSGPGTLMSPATPSSSLPTPKFQQQRRPSGAPSLFSFVSSLSTPPSSPTSSNMSVAPASSYGSLSSATAPVVLLFEAGEIAQSLTLADFYIFKCITGYDYLQGNWRQESPSFRENDYIAMMTQRANRVSHWVLHEILSLKQLKQRRNALRKLIEVSRLCLEWNNFHTSMVITMSLASATLQKLQDTWQALSNKDMSTFQMLQKNLDVSNNMGAYRQAFASKAKAPAIPFFPLVLKDLTFYMDGNPTAVSETDMINFSKFRSMTKCVQSVLRNTDENYWFASDLDHLPFFPGSQDNPHAAGPLDGVADVIENRLHAVGCCHMDSQCESRLYNSLL